MAKDKIRVGIIGTRLMLDSGVLHPVQDLSTLILNGFFQRRRIDRAPGESL